MKSLKEQYKQFFSGHARSVVVKKNVIASLVIKGISIIISLMLVPLTLGYLSSEIYGVWLVLSTMVIWLNHFDIGFTQGLKNKLTESLAKNDYDRGKSLVSTTYVVMVAIFCPLCIIVELIIPYIDWCSLLNIDKVYEQDIVKTIHILTISVCLQMIVNVFTTVVAAYQKVALSSMFGVIGQSISLIVIFILIKVAPPSLPILAISISFIPVTVTMIFSIIYYNKKFKKVKPTILSVNFSLVKDLFCLGYKFFIINIQDIVFYQSTNILISNVSGPEDVTSYNIVYKYIGVSSMIFQIILAPLWPAFTDAFTRKDYQWMKNIYNKMVKFYYVVLFSIVSMVCVSGPVYYLWIGSDAIIPFSMTLAIAIYMIIHTWDSLQITLITGVGAIKVELYLIIIGLVGYLPLALFLGKCIGAIGIVYSMSIVNLLYAIVFTIQIRKIVNNQAKGVWIK